MLLTRLSVMTTPDTITRFAPSPTGMLHIGGARTALFNWLYARGRAGRFLLRIEDTDRARSTPEAVQAIVDGLTWLGLNWDGEPVSQASRAALHRAAAETLLAQGLAYRCGLSADEQAERSAAARDTGAAFRSPWRDKDGDALIDQPHVVRFRMPEDGATEVQDAVQGLVRFANSTLDDLILLRSDGSPTYNLAVVVDDHDMGVTHVIRGDDHLANAPRQLRIGAALGWTPPTFAHIPLIHGPDGKKLSKRHGALGVDAYRDLGMTPAGLRNYLLRLGWSHGDQEVFTDAEARALFDLGAINRAPARLDLDKLASINSHHMRAVPPAKIVELAEPFLLDAYGADSLTPPRRAALVAAAPALLARAQTLIDFSAAARFLFEARPIELSDKAKAQVAGARDLLATTHMRLTDLPAWAEDDIKAQLDAVASEAGVGFGKIGAPLRAALTGGTPAPDIALTACLLGRDETLERLDDALNGA